MRYAGLFLLFFILASCNPGQPLGSTVTLTPTLTLTFIPTPPYIPIVTPSPTPTVTTVPYSDVTTFPNSQPSDWPKKYQDRYALVISDPWHATAEQKADYDDFITAEIDNWLRSQGLTNPEQLQGYDLLNAIADHLPSITLNGSETPEQLASFTMDLPFSLHKLIRTDQNNLVGIHKEPGRYVEGQIDPNPNSEPPVQERGPLQKSKNDWGYNYAEYGLGMNASPKPIHLWLVNGANYWMSSNYGFQFYGEKIPVASGDYSIDGDILLLFKIPGIDTTIAVALLIRMYDGSQIHYAEAFIPLTTVKTMSVDTCIGNFGAGEIIKADACPAGISIPPVEILDPRTGKKADGTLFYLLKLMSLYKNPHVDVVGGGYQQILDWFWKDGISVMSGINTPNLPKDFFSK